MERLVVSPLAYVVALIACICALAGVLVELTCEVREFVIRLFFELPLVAQVFEITGWYAVCGGLLWIFFFMVLPHDEIDESVWLLVIEYGTVD